MVRPLLVLLMLAALAACDRPGRKLSQEIGRQFQLSGDGSVNLAQAVPGPWDHVCVLAPYSDNTAARNALGFAWNAEARTSIHTNDGIALLVFVRDGDVLDYVEHPRGDGDFSNLGGKCFAREESAFVHQPIPARGSSGLVNKTARR